MTSARAGLPRRRLGRSGIEVTVLGIGGWLGELDDPSASVAEREAAAVAAVRRAVDLGIGYFDTAPCYGRDGEAEHNLGVGLRGLDPAERRRLVVSTKVGTHPQRSQRFDRDSVRWSLEHSLQVLGCDRVDIVHVHDPADDRKMDEILAPGGAVQALEELRQQGVIRAIGLGNRTHRYLRRAIDSSRFDVILPSYDYHPVRASLAPVLQLAASAGVGVINGSPYCAGLLAGGDPEQANRRRGNEPADVARARVIWQWCRDRSLDVGALAVQFSTRDERIATTLVGSRTAAEVESSIRHATAALPEETWAALRDFLQQLGPAPPGGEVQ